MVSAVAPWKAESGLLPQSCHMIANSAARSTWRIVNLMECNGVEMEMAKVLEAPFGGWRGRPSAAASSSYAESLADSSSSSN